METKIDDITHIAVCGDSFGVGSGMPLDRCFEDSFGGIVASSLGIPLKVYARSGSCNFVIYLQVKKIVEQVRERNDRPLVLVSLTSHSRLIFPYDSRISGGAADLSNVDYLGYAPYHRSSVPRRKLEFIPVDQPNLTSETISNTNLALHGNTELLKNTRLMEISRRKWQAISIYFEEIYDNSVKMEMDVALATTMHVMLEKQGLPHVIMGLQSKDYSMIPYHHFMEVNWHEISKMHPDPLRTMHCDRLGHEMVANMILSKIHEGS